MKVIDVKSQVLAIADADGDDLSDPTQGTFARHAIRGMAPSPYKLYQSLPSGSSIWEHLDGDNERALMQTDLTGPNQGGPNSFGNDEWGRPIWNDTSVMGCADCHTSDGANTTAGNAHGSDSEYLLKDSHGTATQASEDNPLPTNKGDTATPSYICYKCHNWDKHGPGVGHTGSQADYKESVGNVGPSNRVTGSAQIFGISCLNCHGAPDWGTLHGTSQQFRRPTGGSDPLFDDTVRKAYRFMNGGAQRFYIENNTQTGSYDPDDWAGTSITCWTISGADDWSSCTQHGNGYDWTAPLDRPLRY
jgi:mono/diheme cytochrome c family protein